MRCKYILQVGPGFSPDLLAPGLILLLFRHLDLDLDLDVIVDLFEAGISERTLWREIIDPGPRPGPSPGFLLLVFGHTRVSRAMQRQLQYRIAGRRGPVLKFYLDGSMPDPVFFSHEKARLRQHSVGILVRFHDDVAAHDRHP
jgi:hypothetical protein